MGIQYYRPKGAEFKPPPGSSVRDVMLGPFGNGAGTVYAIGENAKIGFYPELQTWSVIDGSKCCFGWCDDSPPLPVELAKPDQLPGHWVRLADGNKWLIPYVRQIVSGDDDQRVSVLALPCKAKRDGNGGWEYGDVIDQYKDLHKAAETFWDACFAGEGEVVSLDTSWVYGAILAAISANYHMDAQLLEALGIVDARHEGEILGALIDAPNAMARIEEKKSTDKAGAA